MPTFYPSISESLQEWALAQPLFYTATAPNFGRHINVSPKGYTSSCLTVLSPNRAAYLDATGSGCETLSHVYENGRVTLMWCSFGVSPRIMRWFCTGSVIEVGSKGWEEARAWFPVEMKGARAVIVLDVWKVQTSCGFGVPISEGLRGAKGKGGKGEKEGTEVEAEVNEDVEKGKDEAFSIRPTLNSFSTKTMAKDNGRGLDNYRAKWNIRSLDGLPGLKAARRDHGEVLLLGDIRARVNKFRGQGGAVILGMVLGVLMVWAGVVMGWVEIRLVR